MSRSYWLGVAVLSASLVVFVAAASFGQKFIAPNGVQVIKDGDDSQKDSNNDKNKDKNKQGGQPNKGNNANNQNNQGGGQNNQGGQNNKGGNAGSNSSNSNKNNSSDSNKSNGSNSPAHSPPFVQRGKDQKDSDKSDNKDSNKNKDDGKNFRDRNHDGRDDKWDNTGNKFLEKPGFIQNPANGEPVNKKIGFWKGDQWQGSRKMDNWSKVFGHDKQPFSNDWYHEHPRAWKYEGNRSNVWVVASVPGVYSWLGWGNVPQQYRGGNDEPRFDASQFGEWYPLGVYSLMTGPDDVGTRVLQLAVDRHGRINGNYFDMITDSDHGVSGRIQQQTQRAEWTLDQNPNVRFQANIGRLLQPYGSVTVQLPGGEQRWQFVRLEN